MGKAENDPLGVFGASSDVLPIESLPPQGTKEHRNEIRYLVTWRMAVSINGQGFHYGRAKNISLHGAAILSGLNIKPGTSVTLNIHTPPLTAPCKPKTLIIHGITSYAVHDADHLCFRVGVTFVKFEPVADLDYLEERLANHHVKAPDYVCQRDSDRPISRFSSG